LPVLCRAETRTADQEKDVAGACLQTKMPPNTTTISESNVPASADVIDKSPVASDSFYEMV
jgi:hypothetical protein